MTDLTDEGWLALLQSRLAQQLPEIRRYEAYYRGEHPLAFDSEPYRESFGRQLKEFSDNWCELVVEAPVERLAVLGFRFTATASADLETPAADVTPDLAPPTADPADDAGGNPADSDAWAIWQANRLDAESVKGHTEAGKLGTSFLLAAPPREGGDGTPRITVEHPQQVIAVRDPADRRRILAALKRYTAPNADEIAVVYTPEYISTFVSPRGAQSLLASGLILPGSYVGAWTRHMQVPNPLGVVPIVPLENRAGLLTGGISDLRPAIALNDAANKFFADMIVASEFAAFPQRVATGVEIPRDSTGNPVPGVELAASVKRLWAFESPDAKVSSIAAADLGNYVKAIELAVQHLAAQTRTPPHYLLGQIVNIAADALVAAEAGLVSKAVRKQLDFGESWEEAMRLSFRWRALWRRNHGDFAGAELDELRGTDMAAETIWRNPESRSPAIIADALVKKRSIGVPEEMLWEEAGYTPRQIERMRIMRTAELAEAAKRQSDLITEGGAVTLTEREALPTP